MSPAAVIFDLDGVIRDWNDDEISVVEAAHGIEPGAILAAGFDTDLGHAAVTGAMTYRQWMDAIRERIIDQYGDTAIGALDHWEANVGRVNHDMLAVLRAVRERCRVALLSNGTTRLRRDLLALDLHDEFDVIFNTAELGVAKPDPDVFRLVLGELSLAPAEALFIDDLAVNVEGARSVGLRAHCHSERSGTVEFLLANGLALDLVDGPEREQDYRAR